MQWLRVALPTLVVASQAFAWGDTGHRIVGEIAQHNLTGKAERKIREIAGNESLARMSTWPDEIKSDPKNYGHTYVWHYAEIPDGQRYETSPHPAEGDVYTALVRMEQILQNKQSSQKEKLEALRFVVHFIGDLHQPLHVGNGTDRGANWCTVKWFNRRTNLHAVWDGDLIEQTSLSYTEYVKFLEDTLTKQKIKQWSTGNYLDWIHDSQDVRDSIYPTTGANNVPLEGRPYCRDPKTGDVDSDAIPSLGYEYAYKTRSLLDQRLIKGGLRLAAAFNAIFDGKSLAGSKEQIGKIREQQKGRLPAAMPDDHQH